MRKDFRCRFLSYTIVLFAAFLSNNENVFVTYVFYIRYVSKGGKERKDKVLNKACALYALQPIILFNWNKWNRSGAYSMWFYRLYRPYRVLLAGPSRATTCKFL
jgi:hypothetical protein